MKMDEITRIPRVLGAGLATDDGFIVESQFTVGYDAEKSAAMAAQVINATVRTLTAENVSVVLYTQENPQKRLVVFISSRIVGNVYLGE